MLVLFLVFSQNLNDLVIEQVVPQPVSCQHKDVPVLHFEVLLHCIVRVIPLRAYLPGTIELVLQGWGLKQNIIIAKLKKQAVPHVAVGDLIIANG